MNQWIIIAYGILLGINAVTLLLLLYHMRKFRQLNRNFLAVVQNVQAYLNAVMEEPGEEQTDADASREKTYRSVTDTRQAEELLDSVLGEIFS